MQILDGRIVSQAVKDDIKEKALVLKAAGKKTPHLAAVLVGTNGASETYVASKVKTNFNSYKCVGNYFFGSR